jgi:hypothetical protein
MKKHIYILCLLFVSTVALAQFEGTILWGVKMEITDPKLKAQMDMAQKQLNNPENVAKLKELEEKLNDPQFKAIMEQNPEIKAMIEGQLEAMKTGGGGNMLENMLPKSVELHFKNGDSYSKVVGGAFPSEVLHLKATQTTYVIDSKNKTYSVSSDTAEKPADFKVTKTEEFATIMKYKCRKYLTEGVEQGQKIVYSIWATTEIKDLNPKDFSKIKIGRASSSGFMHQIDGVPLKIEGSLQQGKMVMEVSSIKKESLSATLFQVPAGYVEKKSTMGY